MTKSILTGTDKRGSRFLLPRKHLFKRERGGFGDTLIPDTRRLFTGLRLHVPCPRRRPHTQCHRCSRLRGPLCARTQEPPTAGDFVALIHHKSRAAVSILCSISPDTGRGLIPSWLEIEDSGQESPARALLRRLCS